MLKYCRETPATVPFSQQITPGPTWNRTLTLFWDPHETYINKKCCERNVYLSVKPGGSYSNDWVLTS